MNRPNKTAFATLVVFIILASSYVLCAEEIQEIEEIKEVEEVKEATTEAPPAPNTEERGILFYFGRLHPAFVHFPIGWVWLLLILDILTFLAGKTECKRFGLYALGLLVLSCAPALISGSLRQEQLRGATGFASLIESHERIMLVFFGIVFTAFVVRLSKKEGLFGLLKWVYLALIALACLLAIYGGHLGGKMVYGENYLPF